MIHQQDTLNKKSGKTQQQFNEHMLCSWFVQQVSNKHIPAQAAYKQCSISFALASHGNIQPKVWDIQRMAMFELYRLDVLDQNKSARAL